MRRRTFFGIAAAAAPAFAASAVDVKSIKNRGSRKVEIAYKSPHPAPNGLQATREGLWILDDRTVDGRNYVSLVNFADGKVIREFQVPGLASPSGMTVDAEDSIWINSTHSSLIFRCNSQDGTILAKYTCPGSGATASTSSSMTGAQTTRSWTGSALSVRTACPERTRHGPSHDPPLLPRLPAALHPPRRISRCVSRMRSAAPSLEPAGHRWVQALRARGRSPAAATGRRRSHPRSRAGSSAVSGPHVRTLRPAAPT